MLAAFGMTPWVVGKSHFAVQRGWPNKQHHIQIYPEQDILELAGMVFHHMGYSALLHSPVQVGHKVQHLAAEDKMEERPVQEEEEVPRVGRWDCRPMRLLVPHRNWLDGLAGGFQQELERPDC